MYNQNINYNNFLDFQKKSEKQELSRISNELGIFILSYYLLMLAASKFWVLVATLSLGYSEIQLTTPGIPVYLINIFVSVFSALIPCLLYFSFSKKTMSDTIQVSGVKFKYLFPTVCIGVAIAMIANIATAICANNFSFFGIENTINFDTSSYTAAENLLYIVNVAIVPALAEELAFRGVLMGVLRKYGDSFAIVASAVIFACIHRNIVQIPFTFILGLYLAYVVCKTNSLVPSIIIHFINNFYSVMCDIIEKEFSISEITSALVVALFCVLGIVSFIYLAKKDKNYFKLSSSYIYKGNSSLLSFKEKMKTLFLSAAFILTLSIFLIEVVINTNLYNYIVGLVNG